MKNTKPNHAEIIRQIVEGNQEFISKNHQDYFLSHSKSQNPFITLLTCSDSRVQTNAILPDSINKIFTIENIGNQILSSEGSVDYGILHLKTPVLLILGHSDCGAVKAFMDGYESEPKSIKHELDFLKDVNLNLDENSSDFEERLLQNSLKNIDYQVSIALNKYSEKIKNKELVILGAFYDFYNELNKGFGKLSIVNINGKKENLE
jgi:carbonic anhydrase